MNHLEDFLQTIADESCKKRLTGIAIGVIFDGQEISAFSGWADAELRRPVAQSTIFEIGSISKLFTSLLLAVAVAKHEVNLDDPVQTALGQEVKLPTDGKSQITYRSLANHRSSLPRLPDDLIPTGDMKNPYRHYDQAMMYACLNRMKSVRLIGSQTSYSNFGVGLLGHALGRLAGSDYRTALKERVLIPLGMLNTSTEASDEQAAQLATAHHTKTKVTPHWDFTEVTVAAGGVRSSLSDMFKFLRANVTPEQSVLAEELAIMRQPSTLPHCDVSQRRYTSWFWPSLYFVVLALFMTCMFGVRWLTQIGHDGLLHFSIVLVPTLVTATCWGRNCGVATLFLTTFLSWWLWGLSGVSFLEIMWGVIAIVIFSKGHWPEIIEALHGEGRLGWQTLTIGRHPVLWHNGMVGGSASFLGIIEELRIGVVVLTNTAKSVDSIGLKILTELIRRKETGLAN